MMLVMLLMMAMSHHHHRRRLPRTIKTSTAAITGGGIDGVGVVLIGLAATAEGGLFALHLAELLEIALEGLDVILEAEGGHGPEEIVAVDGLPLLPLALVGGLAGDEADELRHALLHRLLRVLRDLRVRRQRLLHDPAHVRDRKQPVLLPRRHLAVRSSVVASSRVVV